MQSATASGHPTRWLRITLGCILLAAAVVVDPASGDRWPGSQRQSMAKLDLALQPIAAARGDQQVRVIVSASSGHVADAARAVAERGWTVLDRFRSIGAVTTILPAGELPGLASDSRVGTLSFDASVESAQVRPTRAGGNGNGRGNGHRGGDEPDSPTTDSDPGSGSWHTSSLDENHLRNTLGLDSEEWDGGDANSMIRVAVIDSGVDHRADVGKIREFYDFTRDRRPDVDRPDRPYDDYGHGTHLISLINNWGRRSGGLFQGIAPKAKVVVLKVLDDDGVGRTSDVIRAIEFAIRHRTTLKIGVINLSLGHPILEPAESDPLVQAVEAAVRSGIIAVVSAGNAGRNRQTGEVGYAGITSPGNAPSAITVGALDTQLTDSRDDDAVAAYSSRGPTWYDGFAKPDLVAPASNLLAAASVTSSLYLENPHLLVEHTNFTGDTTTYIRLSGTSLATAVTSGVVALMLEASQLTFVGEPTQTVSAALTPNAVKAMLQYSAIPLTSVDVLTQGAGGLNADGATALASSLDPRVPTGQWWLAHGITETSRLAGSSYGWGRRLVWGDRVVWGNDEIYVNEAAWSLPVVWGDRLVWGDRIVWGNIDDSVVWGDRLVWGNRLVWGDSVLGVDDGTEVVYGDRIIWGNVTADRLVWGNLDAGSAGSMGVQ